jgi:hypothetical protein
MDNAPIGGDRERLLKIFISPFTLAIPIIIIVSISGRSPNFARIPSHFMVGVGAVFLILSTTYVMIAKKNKLKAAIAVAAVANGILLVFLSYLFEAGMFFGLAGFAIILAGMLLAMTMIAPPSESLFARKIDSIISQDMSVDELRKILESIQFPCVFLEREANGPEKVIAYNASFITSFNLDTKKILGSSLDSLLPIDRELRQMKFEGEEWVVKRTVKGRQVLLMLSPVPRSNPAKIEVYDAIDPATGLFAMGFMKYKARGDIEAIVRGKRRLSAALFKIFLPDLPVVGLSEEEQKLACVVFGRTILASVRACDSAYRTGDDEVLLLMPDTPSAGAEIVVNRIYASLKSAGTVMCPALSKTRMDYVQRDYVGGGDLPGYDKILEELTVAMYSKNPELIVGA